MLIQAGSLVTRIGSDLSQALVSHGLRRAHIILSTSTALGSHNLLWSGSGRHLGSGNVLAACVSKKIFAFICIYIPVELY